MTASTQERKTRKRDELSSVKRAFLFAVTCPLIYFYYTKKRKQRLLTKIPVVFRQITPQNDALCSLMSSVLQRSVRPSLFFKQVISSAEADKEVLTVRQLINIVGKEPNNNDPNTSHRFLCAILLHWNAKNEKKDSIFKERGPICHPVVLVIGNSIENECATSNCVKSLSQECLRNNLVVAQLVSKELTMKQDCCASATEIYINNAGVDYVRLAVDFVAKKLAPDQPLFLIGYSLGASLVVKYLGREGLKHGCNKIPRCVAGAISVSNPLHAGNARNTKDDTKHDQDFTNHNYYLSQVSVPLLKIVAPNDRRAYSNATQNPHFCTKNNPNVIVVAAANSTGHSLYWPVSRRYGLDELLSTFRKNKDSKYSGSGNWSDRVSMKFITAILNLRSRKENNSLSPSQYLDVPHETSNHFLRSKL